MQIKRTIRCPFWLLAITLAIWWGGRDIWEIEGEQERRIIRRGSR